MYSYTHTFIYYIIYIYISYIYIIYDSGGKVERCSAPVAKHLGCPHPSSEDHSKERGKCPASAMTTARNIRNQGIIRNRSIHIIHIIHMIYIIIYIYMIYIIIYIYDIYHIIYMIYIIIYIYIYVYMVIHNKVIKQYSPIFYVKWNAHPVMSAVITHHWCWDAMRETNPNGNLKTRQAKSLWHSETWHFQAFSSHSVFQWRRIPVGGWSAGHLDTAEQVGTEICSAPPISDQL